MQPLKRFTQCGSLTMLFVVFIVLFGVSSTALTTFGKASPNTVPVPPTPPPVKGRECNTHADCSSLQFTSCVKDLDDDKLRCLCGDNRAPINGLCTANRRSLRHMCVDTNQCEDEMVCAADNSTKSTGFNRNSNSGPPAAKICLCDEENGFTEDVQDNRCNGAIQMVTSIFMPLLYVILGKILSTKPLH